MTVYKPIDKLASAAVMAVDMIHGKNYYCQKISDGKYNIPFM